jgi:hypothetical protein
MLAIVKSAATISGPLQYNELKVEQHQAIFLDAHNFLQEKEELTLRDKQVIFQHIEELNERSLKKTIHISINFPETDALSEGQLVRITDDFMRGIGFADQPWLLYQHLDAGHPHVHVVTTSIRPDGSRISNDLRSPYHLKQLCFAIEQSRGLTPAIPMPDLFGINESLIQKEQCRMAQRATYGKKPTKTQIRDVLQYVNQNFSFTSFEAYNAVLSLYNVRADRGREDSAMRRIGGLYYRMIDSEGRKLGAPIKASAFNEPATLQKLEQKYALSQVKVQQVESRLKIHIDYALAGHRQDYSLHSFANDLRRDRVQLVIPALTQRMQRKPKAVQLSEKKSDDGHSIFYVNFNSMTVTRDTDLGPRYTGAAILERTGIERELRMLIDEGKLKLSRSPEREALKPDYPDAAETRRVLFKLSPQHSMILEKKLELKQRQEQTLRQTRGIRRSM